MRSPFRTKPLQTIAQAIEIAMSHVVATKSPNTVRTYRSHARQLTADFGERLLASLTTADIESWRARRLELVSVATVNGAISFLSVTYTIAKKSGWVAFNPVQGVEWINPRNNVEQLMGHEQERRMVAWMREQWPDEPATPLVVELGTLTGMRRSEMFNLRRENVKLEESFDAETGERIFGSISILKPKGKKSSRWVPLSAEAAQVLRELMATSKDAYVIPPMWKSTRRIAVAYQWMRARFKPAAAFVGLENLRVHDLRHTFANRSIEEGRASLHEVKELLGHEYIQTTLRYTNPTRRHLHSVMQRMARARGTTRPAA